MSVTPPLLLTGTSSLIADHAYWTWDDNTGDPFIGSPYQWEIQLNITAQLHSSGTTLTPYVYNGLDIKVGDWWCSANGVANVIVEITNQAPDNISCIVEDLERYNLFSDPNQSGSGLAPDGAGFIFRIGDEGLPILGPMADYQITPTVADNIMARFIARNGVKEFVLVNQPGHSMNPGDVIYADFVSGSGYQKVDAVNYNRAIGIVSEINTPGLDYFCYRPLGVLINNVNPPLRGSHGDVFYLDPTKPGGVTNIKPSTNAVPVYLQLDLPTRAILLERGVESVQSSGGNTDNETHKYDVTNVAAGQTMFTMPSDAREILYMAINGIENENFTFDIVTKVLIFDPVETGYGIDADDDIFFIYKS